MVRDALLEVRTTVDVRAVASAEELLAFLGNPTAYEGRATPAPSLIVIDAKLPGEPEGLAAVRAIKSDPDLRSIPIVALGATADPEAVAAAYASGVSTFIVKPVTFLELVRLMKVFGAYWLETVELPPAA